MASILPCILTNNLYFVTPQYLRLRKNKITFTALNSLFQFNFLHLRKWQIKPHSIY